MIFLRNVWRAKVRSLMTVLGVAAGVALFVAITAITTDLRQQIAGAAQAYELEVVVYERRSTSPFSSKITRAQMEALRAAYGDAVSALVVGSLRESWNPYALVIGAEPAFIARIPLTAGRPLGDDGQGLLLGEIAAQRLGLQPGQSITLAEQSYEIRGLFRTGSRFFDGGAMGPLDAVQALVTQPGTEPQYTMALMRSRQAQGTAALIADVHQRFPALKALPATELAGALRLVRVVEAFVTTISVIAIVGTALVVTNTLVMAVAERTREIGILMAVGWTPWLVLRMLMAESLLLCVVGALVGDALALALLHVVNSLESVGFGWIPVRLSLGLIGQSLLMTTLVALLALSWPAVVLYRMQPLTALRHE